MNAPKMAATAIIINCSVNQKTKQKKKNLDCFADEKTETLGKGRRFLCSLREKKKCIYKCQWDVGVQVALATTTKILGPVCFQIKIFNDLYSKVFQWPD